MTFLWFHSWSRFVFNQNDNLWPINKIVMPRATILGNWSREARFSHINSLRFPFSRSFYDSNPFACPLPPRKLPSLLLPTLTVEEETKKNIYICMQFRRSLLCNESFSFLFIGFAWLGTNHCVQKPLARHRSHILSQFPFPIRNSITCWSVVIKNLVVTFANVKAEGVAFQERRKNRIHRLRTQTHRQWI